MDRWWLRPPRIRSAYRRFGSRVTVIQNGPQLLAGQDPDVAAEILQMFASEEIDVLSPAEIVSVQGRSGASVHLVVRSSSEDRTIQASDVLVATGRAPNTAGIGLEFAGVELDQHAQLSCPRPASGLSPCRMNTTVAIASSHRAAAPMLKYYQANDSRPHASALQVCIAIFFIVSPPSAQADELTARNSHSLLPLRLRQHLRASFGRRSVVTRS
jgi:hypothetical protein